MRLWHYRLLPYLPDAQFRGQLRELIAIMRDWRDKGKTNHLLINVVTEYPKAELAEYFKLYSALYYSRYEKNIKEEYVKEFNNFCSEKLPPYKPLFEGWHTEGYLRVCMTNLFEKYYYGRGNSQITDEEWDLLLYGYRRISGRPFMGMG